MIHSNHTGHGQSLLPYSGHPIKRLIDERPPYDVDLEKIMAAAKERGCFRRIENGEPPFANPRNAAAGIMRQVELLSACFGHVQTRI